MHIYGDVNKTIIYLNFVFFEIVLLRRKILLFLVNWYQNLINYIRVECLLLVTCLGL